MRVKAALLFVFVVILIPHLVFSAGKQAEETAPGKLKEIRFLCMAGATGDAYTRVFADFDKYGFTVIVDQVPWVTYLEKAQLAVQSKTASYDVLDSNVEWTLPSWVLSGGVMPLNDFLEDDPVDFNRFIPISIDNVAWPRDTKLKPTGRYKNWDDALIYGIPSIADTTPLTYRKDWFEEAGLAGPPKNWDEFLVAAKKITQDTNGDGTPDRYGYAFASVPEGGQLTDYWMMFIYSWGANLLDENFKPAFNNRKGIEATQFMADLLHKHKVVPPGVLTYGIPQAFDAYIKGVTGMTTQWGYTLASVEDPNESVAAGKSGYTSPPVKERVAARYGQWAFTIPSNASDPKKSWEFIKRAISEEVQIALLPGVPPPGKEAGEYALENYPKTYLVGHIKTYSQPDIAVKPQIPNILEVDAAVAYPVFEAISGQKDVSQALEEAEKAAIPLLEKLK